MTPCTSVKFGVCGSENSTRNQAVVTCSDLTSASKNYYFFISLFCESQSYHL